MKVAGHLKRILETGSKIIGELKKDKPSINTLQELYNLRSRQVSDFSVILASNPLSKLEDDEKMVVGDLFKSLHSKEKIINQKLITLSNKKENELDLLNQKLKAENRYREQQKRTNRNPHLLNKNLQG